MLSLHRNRDLPEVAVTITNETFVRLALLTIGTLLVLAAANRASHALLLIFTSFFLALALNSPVHWVSRNLPGKMRGRRALATALSFFIVILLLGGFLVSIVPPLVRQTETFVSAAPELVQNLRSEHNEIGKFIRRHHLQNQVNDVSSQLAERLKHSGGTAFSTVKKVGSSVFSLLTILVLTFMMLVEGPRWIEFGRSIVPQRGRAQADRMTLEMYQVIKGYVNGQVTLAALAAVLIMPAVILLHISYPIALMVIIFICGLIPLVGHTIGATIVTIVALFHSLTAAIIILAYYILYQQLENIFIQPRIQANSTNMSPLLVFASVVIGVSFGGLFWGLVAIPAAGCLRIAILEYLRNRKILDAPEFEQAMKGTK